MKSHPALSRRPVRKSKCLVEVLESRIAPAFTGAVVGNTAVFTDAVGSSTTLTIFAAGGVLHHNQPFTVGTAGAFNSDMDFDSTQAGDQTLSTASAYALTINAGDGNDIINLGTATNPASAFGANGTFTVNGEAHTTGDTLVIENSADTTARTVGVSATQVTLNGTTINYATVEALTINTGTQADTFNLTGSAVGVTYTLNGGGGNDIVAVTADGNFGLTNTSLTVTAAGFTSPFTLTSIEVANLTGGAGANTFTVGGWTGSGTITGGGGSDTIAATKDVNFVLTNSTLTASDGLSLNLVNISVANLTGGASANSFTVSGWSGSGTMDGQGGTDTIVATNDIANFGLTDTSLVRSGLNTLTLAGIEVANLTGGASANTFTVGGWSGIGTMDGQGGSDTIAATNDIANFGLTDTSLVRSGLNTLTLANIEVANLTGGPGANTFTVGGWSGTGTMDGQGGIDTIAATNDVANFGLTDTSLVRTGLGTLTLAGIEVANLTGGPSSNTFTVGGWSGTGTMDGQGGSDTIVATNDIANFTLTDTSLARTGLGTLTLSGIEVANLTGGPSDNAFTVSGWSGTGTMDGGLLGIDTIIANNDVSDFILTDGSLARTGLGTLTLLGIDVANLTGGASSNTFTVTGWSGTGTMDGQGGSDTIAATNDVANFTLTDTSLARTGFGTLTLANIEVANLTGGASANTFTVSGWSGTGTMDGQGGSDTIAATNDLDFVLTDTSLARSGLGTLTLAGIEVANLTGGASANTFTVSGWSGTGTMDGQGGTDTIVATNDVDFVLTDTSLARTGLGTLTLAGIEAANLTGGASANTFNTTAFTGTVTLDGMDNDDTFIVAPDQNGSVEGGNGTNTLVSSGDVDFTITDSNFNGNLTLAHIQAAQLTGGLSDNQFDTTGFSGTVTLKGMGGDDTFTVSPDQTGSVDGGAGGNHIVSSGDADFTLSDTALNALALTNIGDATLTGGISANTFDINGWSGTGTFSGGAGDDIFNLTNWTGSGTVNGDGDNDKINIIHWTATGTVNGGAGNDTITITDWEATGTINGDAGNDDLKLAADGAWTLPGVFNGGDDDDTADNFGGTFNGGNGTDTIIDSADANFTLSDTLLTRTGSGSVPTVATILAGVENAFLTGGDSANTFDINGWSGTGIFTGGKGNDIFNLTNWSGTGTVNGGDDNDQINIINWTATGVVNGGNGNDTITITHWTAAGTVNGDAGNDTLIAADGTWTVPGTFNGGDNDDSAPNFGGTFNGGNGTDTISDTFDSNFTLKDDSLTRATGTPVTTILTSVENAVLTGGASANTFDIGPWSGTGTFSGLDNNDIFNLTNWTGTGTVNGGNGNDTFNITHWSAPGTINGDAGDDVLTAADGAWSAPGTFNGGIGKDTAPNFGGTFNGGDDIDTIKDQFDADFTLKDTSLVRKVRTASTGLATLLTGVENGILTGGASANVLNALGFSGTVTLTGLGGVDNLIASKGDSTLIGFDGTLPTPQQLRQMPALNKAYTFDNYFISDGTQAATDVINATNRIGNVISFRYFVSDNVLGVKYTIPDAANIESVARSSSAPEVKVQLQQGRLSDLEGSRYRDVLVGSRSIANFISGGAGNDVLVSVRVDALFGGKGVDTFIGATPFKYQEGVIKFSGFTGIPPIPTTMTTTLLGAATAAASPTVTPHAMIAAIARFATDLTSPSWFVTPSLN